MFVCIGNICRSPVAEYWARDQLQKKGFADIEVASAGLSAMKTWPIAPEMKLILDRHQIDASSHAARQVDEKIIANADIIFVMESFQQKELLFVFPGGRGKIFCLGKWTESEITDPYRKDQAVFESVFESIKNNWEMWQKKLWI